MPITLDSHVRICPGILFCDLGEEAVMLHLDSGIYYGLDGVGLRIWRLLKQHGVIRPVLESLLEEYDVDEPRLSADLLAFVQRLADRGLVTTSDDG